MKDKLNIFFVCLVMSQGHAPKPKLYIVPAYYQFDLRHILKMSWKLELKHELMVILLLSLKFFSGCENVRKSAEGFDGFQSDLAAFCPLHPLILF